MYGYNVWCVAPRQVNLQLYKERTWTTQNNLIAILKQKRWSPSFPKREVFPYWWRFVWKFILGVPFKLVAAEGKVSIDTFVIHVFKDGYIRNTKELVVCSYFHSFFCGLTNLHVTIYSKLQLSDSDGGVIVTLSAWWRESEYPEKSTIYDFVNTFILLAAVWHQTWVTALRRKCVMHIFIRTLSLLFFVSKNFHLFMLLDDDVRWWWFTQFVSA